MITPMLDCRVGPIQIVYTICGKIGRIGSEHFDGTRFLIQESNPLLRPFCSNIKGCQGSQVDGTLKASIYNVSIGSELQIA